jgi:parallel beta-helix repeat protein
VTNNIVYDTKVYRGIYLQSSSNNNVIINNKVFNNTDHGIHLTGSNSNTVANNMIYMNPNHGIYITSSSSNSIIGNNIINNLDGIYLQDSSDNWIYYNNIIDNTNQAYDNRDDNYWDNDYPSGGNYWSDFDEPGEGAYDNYKGPGQDVLGSDGIVDNGTIGGGGKNPYVIDLDSQDNYPLIKPYKNYLILKQGWNLISIPLLLQEQNLTKVFASINGLYDAVQCYNITDTADPWKHNKIGKPYGNDLSKIDESMGIWIHIIPPGDTIFYYNGIQPITNQTIQLHPGWNLVGYPSLTGNNRTEGLNNLTFYNEVDAILTYNAATHKWKKLGPSDYFEIGMGYWIHANTKCEWEVPL